MVNFELERYRFEDEKMVFIAPTYQEMDAITFDMAQQLIDLQQQRGFQLDLIIAVSNGGMSFAPKLVRDLEIAEKATTIAVNSYAYLQKIDDPRITQPFPIDIHGKKVCVLDDTSDKGDTLDKICNEFLPEAARGGKIIQFKEAVAALLLRKKRPETTIVSAVHFVKEGTHFIPDVTGMDIGHEWVIFPDDIAETTESFYNRWRDLSYSEVKQRLELVFHADTNPGISKQIDFFYARAERKLYVPSEKLILASA